MRTCFYATSFILAASAAQADGHYSDLLAQNGPTRAAEMLADAGIASPSDRFALGGMQFLSAVEGALQTRYAYGVTEEGPLGSFDAPFLRLPIAPNPNPKPFSGQVIETIFQNAADQLADANENLDAIQDTDDVAVKIAVEDIWFDINRNGTYEVEEGFLVVAATVFGDMDSTGLFAPIDVQFDTADAAWLSAYAHMLSGVSELILSTDPGAAISAVLDGGATMDDIRDQPLQSFGFIGANEIPMIDAFASVIVALEGQPDATRTRAAHQHFLDAIADNRIFWTRLGTETDNENEWIPNARQVSAMPMQFPPGVADAWQAVLADAEDVLTGEQLIPHWRLGTRDTAQAGLNLAKLLQDPPVIDVIGLFQGYTLAPYAERGPVVTFESMAAFDDLTGGNSPLFAIVLN